MKAIDSQSIQKPGARLRPLALLAGFLLIGQAHTAPFDVSQVPLNVGSAIPPNLMYIHDDSGSMGFGFLPESVGDLGDDQKRKYSPDFNKIYYDPAVNYAPPVDHNGQSLGDSSFTDAWENGYQKDAGKRNLSTDFMHSIYYRWGWNDLPGYTATGTTTWKRIDKDHKAAYYYRFDSSLAGCGVANAINLEKCYKKVVVSATSGPGGVDERKNFANWFSYYRVRNFAAKAGISRAFSGLGSGIRVGYGSINGGTGEGGIGDVIKKGVRTFEGSDREAFFKWLFKVPSDGGTPLPQGLRAAGKYFYSDDSSGPWSTTPGAAGGEVLSCRKTFTILMTDGYWNDENGLFSVNHDGANGPDTITGPGGKSYTYSAASPFSDSYTKTLADVAMYYWKTDLNSAENRVPTTVLNPAFWQHMVTYGVGLGVAPESINPDDAFNAIINGTPTITWPQATKSDHQIDDLLHASVNGRGGFYSAANPQEFATVLQSALAKILDETSTASAPAASSTSITEGTLIYQAKFDTSNWSGQLLARELCPLPEALGGPATVTGCENREEGEPKEPPVWDAATQIPSHSSRKIYTWKPVAGSPTGVEFAWANLTTGQQAYLDNQSAMVNFLRGDTSGEKQNGGNYRNRAGKKLGDIINSDPFFVGTGDFGYATAAALTDAERTSYRERKLSDTYKDRTTMLYVGANDGMLHAFDASTGGEKFAYIPNAVFPNLKKLADPAYTHSYYVDGSPKAGDALINGEWRTVLVGSTGAGGRAYFALDVEQPDSFAASRVLWEFTHDDLGTALGQASVVRTESGDWVAIFGNGYNSTNHTAQLFVVNIKTGELIAKIDTKAGTSDKPNGLATPLTVDANGNGAADLVYAGDMHGNLWKFDLSGSKSEWKIPFSTTNPGGESVPAPLFTAMDGTGGTAKEQPITAKPQAKRHPETGGVMVYFGTGQYFETGDQANEDLQTFYGVLDTCGKNPGTDDNPCKGKMTRSDLVQQTILNEYTETFTKEVGGSTVTNTEDIRILSENEVDYKTKYGFYLDLAFGSIKKGERVVGEPVVWSDRIIFTSIIPDDDPCNSGGDSWIMELDPSSGGRTLFSVFDLNKDRAYDKGDYGQNTPVNGRKIPGGLVKKVAVVGDNKYASLPTGLELIKQKQNAAKGRQSWRQIR